MTIYKTDNQQEPTESIEKCTQYFVIRYKGKEPEKIYILKMESLCCTPKTNTTLWINYAWILKKNLSGEEVGCMGSLGMVDADYDTENDKPWGLAVQHRELCLVSWTRPWWKIIGEKQCIYMYDWVTMLYSRNWHYIVNQL